MDRLSDKFSRAFRVKEILARAEKYLAHLPRPARAESQQPETLGEHMELVLAYARRICEVYGLDAIIEALIDDIVDNLHFVHRPIAKNYMFDLFVDAIVFHDFGKTNEFFQLDKMKNNDPLFKGHMPELFSPRSGHSELGAFIFSVFHLEKINDLEIPEADEADKTKLSVLALFFSNSILLHHSPKLSKPQERISKSQFLDKRDNLKKYIQLYRDFPQADISNAYFDALKDVFTEFECYPIDFSLFALLRLNFSILTAADYLATGQYSYGLELKTEDDWGILSDEKRAEAINSTRSNQDKPYNIIAYELLKKIGSSEEEFIEPQTLSEENLNILRTEMAVKVLQTLEKHHDNRLFYLEAPTGGGKTNLSMLAVSELLNSDKLLKKVFYVFPFTTLITQTHKAIKETLLLDDTQVALLHSRAGFQTSGTKQYNTDEEDAIYGGQRRDFLQNLFALYPFTLITHVRFFDILKSNRKDDIYLMHRLANSVIILDELQSYPPRQWDKMLYLLDQYGKFFNIRFILMSATLPRLTEIEAIKRASGKLPEVIDLLPNAKSYFQNPNFKGRVSFRFALLDKGELSGEELAAIVLEKSRDRAEKNEGRVFTIVEFIFKKSATEFRSIIESSPTFFDEIFVLSGTILESRRRIIINYLKRKRTAAGLKILLITTQVVEAGVDIDMDLGFKNVSLIDSDEQLAGRVNRNVGKRECEVWLFRKDDPMVLYKSDYRYQITKNLPSTFHQEVLENKDFALLYRRVFDEIEKRNKNEMIENFSMDYLNHFRKLDYLKIDEKFKIIDQQTISVFVPALLPTEIEDQYENIEPFFNKFELDFLSKATIDDIITDNGGYVNGAAVWKLYRDILSNPNEDFIAKKIEQKVMQGILAKFTFSMFASDSNRSKLALHSLSESSLPDYYYLHRWKEDDIYSLESGLNESKLVDPIL